MYVRVSMFDSYCIFIRLYRSIYLSKFAEYNTKIILSLSVIRFDSYCLLKAPSSIIELVDFFITSATDIVE